MGGFATISAEQARRRAGRLVNTVGEVPEALVDAILAGRCVAFVGAGFSRPAVPTWSDLLKELARKLGEDSSEDRQKAGHEIFSWLEQLDRPSAFELESAGQSLRAAWGDTKQFEAAVQEAVRVEPTAEIVTRSKLLREIPFEAILTTNYDPILDDPRGEASGYAPDACYLKVLRGLSPWWERVDWKDQAFRPRAQLIKLHGDANGNPELNPIVLGRRDYRGLLYKDSRYASFLRALFATRTILFMGTSFTDAYLNELRSEVLALRRPGDDAPLWYALRGDVSEREARYFRTDEGIHLLHYQVTHKGPDGVVTQDFSGFNAWIEAIHAKTAARQRLQALLRAGSPAESRPKVVWVDPNTTNTDYGLKAFEDVGAEVVQLDSPQDLEQAAHQDARLLITRYGYPAQDALRVLETVATWGERPPVVVFGAGGEHAQENRATVLRHGAYEFTAGWKELFEVIERLFGRRVGEPSRAR